MKSPFTAAMEREFNVRALALLDELGAEDLGEGERALQTRMGRLWIRPYGHWCAMRLGASPEVAAELRSDTSFNPHSHKWNFQGMDPRVSVDTRIELLRRRIEQANRPAPEVRS